MMKQRVRTLVQVIWTVVLGLALPGVLAAQGVTTAALGGTVTANGQPVAGAEVTVRNTATGFSRTATTGQDGRYFVPNLLPGGPYSVTASGAGFGAQARGPIRLVLNQTATVDFQLAEQVVALEGLTVTAENNPVISRSRTGAATVVGEETLETTPTLSRNFTEVARLSPHVTGSSETPSVGGANNRFNNIQIDGATTSDIFGLGSSGTPGGQGTAAKPIPLDAIEQFQVLVTPFDVRQAGFTGGLINAVTKSGTNRFSGSAFVNYRNENFVRGDTLRGYGQSFAPPRAFTNQQFGATLGGPILRDRLFFFFSGELETRETPGAFGRNDPNSIGIRTQTLDEIASIAQGYGITPGNADPFTEEVRLGNLFGRLDYRINDSNRLVLRHNYAPKRDDAGPSRGGSNFDFSSYNYFYKTDVNSTVLQLFSDFGTDLTNELLVNFQRITDRPSPETFYPALEITVNDTINGVAQPRRTVRLGAEFSRQYNELDQDMFQVTNNLTWNRGAHRLTFGVNAEYFDFRNAFIQNYIGTYAFNSVADFRNGRVNRFTRNVPLRENPVAEFAVFQPGGYLQDEWTVSDNLNITAGLRVDVPIMLDDPEQNPTFVQAFGRDNSETPSGKPLISPRVGFNWQNDASLRTQLRGGVGMFSGRPPYVWLSNAFSNTGVDFAQITCSGANAPVYNSQTAQQGPTTCGAGPSAGVVSVNSLSPDYRFPQELKASLGVDQELPLGLTGTFEFIYSKGIDRTISREINLQGPQTVPASAMQGIGNRTIYGTPQNDASFAFNPVRIDDRFRQVVELDRLTAGYAYTLVGELARTFGENLDVRAAYTWNRSRDPGSFGSSTATSNVGLHPIGEQINDFSLAPSSFERPHKVTLVGTYSIPGRLGTELSAVYIGQSGRNYYYIYQGDVNGDGYPGSGVTNRYNDLIYVPNDISEVNFTSADDRRLFEELIGMESCLQNARGGILERYTCRAPWQNRLDARIMQPIQLRGSRLQAELNIFNLPNLLNSDWGLQQGIQFSDVFALDFDNRVNPNDPTSAPKFRYAGRTTTDENGVRHAELPYTTFFDSRYQIQFGLRWTF
ncbi:MAG TPA: TonB-dependent receptor [Longimicrobiaceae bacterium]|nr:TonB-dependent receptor [Longimicrobiaceae bacterium]